MSFIFHVFPLSLDYLSSAHYCFSNEPDPTITTTTYEEYFDCQPDNGNVKGIQKLFYTLDIKRCMILMDI